MSIRTTHLNSSNLFLSQMQVLQNKIAKTQQQIGSGEKLQAAKDDPVAAGSAVALQRAEAQYKRFGENATMLGNRLQREEGVLSSVSDTVMRLRELAIQASNGTMSQGSRAALLPEIAELRKSLLASANSVDGDGRYIFAGTQDGSAPFSNIGGVVAYTGDQTQRQLDVAPGLSIADTDIGSDVFMRIRNGNGLVNATANSSNTGTAVISSDGFIDQSQWDGGTYRLQFGAGTWQVLDSGGATIGSGSFVAGQAISFRGYQITVSGQPAAGDEITVGAASTQSIFSLVDELSAALQAPDTPASAQASLQNRLYGVLQDLDQANNHFIDRRASLGARLSALDAAGDEREAVLLETQKTLSQLKDLDYAEALTRLSQASTALQAAQQTYSRVASLSLFDVIR